MSTHTHQTLEPLARDTLGPSLWCWGCDVRYPDGNLFERFGLRKHRSEHAGRTGYHTADDAGVTLWFWGFGVAVCGPEHAWYFDRHDPRPRHTRREHADALTPLGLHQPWYTLRRLSPRWAVNDPQALEAWHRLVRFATEYERYVAATLGSAYRMQCLRECPDPCHRRADLLERWRRCASAADVQSHNLRHHVMNSRTLAASGPDAAGLRLQETAIGAVLQQRLQFSK